MKEMGEKGILNFEDFSYNPRNRRSYKKYNMTKDGFTLLVMDENAKIRFLLVGSDVLNFEPIKEKETRNREQIKYN